MPECICHLRPTHSSWDGPKDIPFTTTMRNEFLRGAPASLKSSSIILLCSPDLIVGTAAIQLENLNAMEYLDAGVSGAKW